MAFAQLELTFAFGWLSANIVRCSRAYFINGKWCAQIRLNRQMKMGANERERGREETRWKEKMNDREPILPYIRLFTMFFNRFFFDPQVMETRNDWCAPLRASHSKEMKNACWHMCAARIRSPEVRTIFHLNSIHSANELTS